MPEPTRALQSHPGGVEAITTPLRSLQTTHSITVHKTRLMNAVQLLKQSII